MGAKLRYLCPDSDAISGFVMGCFLEESFVCDDPEGFIVSEEEW